MGLRPARAVRLSARPSNGELALADPAPASAGEVAPPRRRSALEQAADVLTLAGVVLVPSTGFGIGGRLGIAFGDILMVLAVAARGLQFLAFGVPVRRLRQHGLLLCLLGAFAVAGMVSGTIHGDPFNRNFIVVVASMLGPVVLVATYGGRIREVAYALVAGTTFLALSTVWNPTAKGRYIGLLTHPNALGHSCVVGCAVAVWLADHAESARMRALWLAAAVVNVIAVVLSGSRGGTLGLLVGGAIYLSLRGNWRMTVAAITASWLVVLALVGGVVQLPEGNPIQRQLTEASSNTGSNEARRQRLQENLEDIGESPVLGKGFDTVAEIHTVYFQGWIGGGFVCALLLFLIGALVSVRPFWQRRRDLALACGGTALALMWVVTNLIAARDQWVLVALVFSCTALVPPGARNGNGSR